MSLFLRNVLSCERNGKGLMLVTWRWKSTETFTKKKRSNMKKPCRDIKKIIWMKWRLSTSTKGIIRQAQRHPQRQTQRQVQRQSQKLLRTYTTFLREQLGKMTGKELKNYQSIASGRWKKIKDPRRQAAYNNRAR